MLGFVGAVLILLWLFQVSFLDSFYRRIKIKEMHESAKIISQNYGSEGFAEKISSYSYDKGMSVEIITDDGQIIFSEGDLHNFTMQRYTVQERINEFERVKAAGGTDQSFQDIRKPINPFDTEQNGVQLTEDFQKDITNETTQNHIEDNFDHRGSEYNDVKNLVYSEIVQTADGEIMIMLNTLLTPIGSTTEILKVELSYITLILMAFSVILAYVIFRQISKPIIKTNDNAKELANANYDVQFAQDGYKEIAQLNETLSYAAQELSKTEKLQRELLSNISHDLRTPLTLITGYAEVMRDIPGENTPENVQVIIDEGRRLSDLVTDILDISKLQAAVSELDLYKISLTKKIESVLTRYNKLKEQDGYIIEFIKDEEAFVMADEIKLLQVLYNLINNAINYTGADKKVIIKQTVENNHVKIEIIDTGEGIEKENIPFIWDRYFKVEKNHKRAKVGTGLGLSIVKNILELHNATFGVESEVGMGSCFWFEMEIIKDNKKI
ncbi:MAG TPA: two-component sensor histidine kinase [Lachnospiraceae bacterium]|nr:two-component sensor histidine kinase [Lachnospiraceae bacterium]